MDYKAIDSCLAKLKNVPVKIDLAIPGGKYNSTWTWDLDAALDLALLTAGVAERGIICLCGCLKPRHSHAFQEACILFGDTLDKAQQDRTEQK